MTCDAEFHRVLDLSGGNRHLSNIAMTGRAIDLRQDVRRVVESHVGFFHPTPHALPRNVLSLVEVPFHLLNFRPIRRRRCMTVPAGADIGYRCLGTSGGADMTIHTCELDVLDVDIVRERDRLNRFGSISEEMGNGFRDGTMGGRKNGVRVGACCLAFQ